MVLEFIIGQGDQALAVAAVTQDTVLASTPSVHHVLSADGNAVVVTRSNLVNLDTLLLKVFNLLRVEVRLEVVVAQRANFLLEHASEQALLATIAPGKDLAALRECHGMVLAQLNIFDFQVRKSLH